MRSILTVLLSTGTIASAVAQLEIRPYVGVNQQNLTEAPAFSTWKAGTGYQLGADLMLGGRVYMTAGAQFMTTNTVLSTTVTGQSTAEGTLNTGLVRVPVRLGFRFMDPEEKPTVNVRAFGGLIAGFPITSTFDQDGLRDVELGTGQFHVTFGAGLDISIFFLEAGYDMGLSPVFDDDRFQVDPKANILHVNAGVRLKFAR